MCISNIFNTLLIWAHMCDLNWTEKMHQISLITSSSKAAKARTRLIFFYYFFFLSFIVKYRLPQTLDQIEFFVLIFKINMIFV